jgi:ssDNA-binding Zn-finger/Zn-ribbon topoisomerase 1
MIIKGPVHGRAPDRRGEAEFKYKKDREYIGEQCPKCEMEMYLIRGKPGRKAKLNCHCGYSIFTTEYVRRMRDGERLWCNNWIELEKPNEPNHFHEIELTTFKFNE